MRRILTVVISLIALLVMAMAPASAHVMTADPSAVGGAGQGATQFTGDGSPAPHHAGPLNKGLHNACESEGSPVVSFNIPTHGC